MLHIDTYVTKHNWPTKSIFVADQMFISVFLKILIRYNLIFFVFLFLQIKLQLPIPREKIWKTKMEDDVEVELELEKQLSLAHEMFWQLKVEIFSQQRELLLNNNFSRQRKLSNFEEDEFPKKQSNLCFYSEETLPCGEITSNNENQDGFLLSGMEAKSKKNFIDNYYYNIPSTILMSLIKVNKIFLKWIGFDHYSTYK